MDQAESKVFHELQEQVVELIVAISRAHNEARAPLSDAMVDAFGSLERIREILAPYSRSPFD